MNYKKFMKNTIIDLIRIPVNEDGDLLYDMDWARNFYDNYTKMFPDHKAFMMPADITIWEDLDIITLKTLYSFLGDIIKQKEQ